MAELREHMAEFSPRILTAARVYIAGRVRQVQAVIDADPDNGYAQRIMHRLQCELHLIDNNLSAMMADDDRRTPVDHVENV